MPAAGLDITLPKFRKTGIMWQRSKNGSFFIVFDISYSKSFGGPATQRRVVGIL
jgi:hypothetical protein